MAPFVLLLGVVDLPSVDGRRFRALERCVVSEREESRGGADEPVMGLSITIVVRQTTFGRERIHIRLERLGVDHSAGRWIHWRFSIKNKPDDLSVLEEKVEAIIVVAHGALPSSNFFHGCNEMDREGLFGVACVVSSSHNMIISPLPSYKPLSQGLPKQRQS